MLDRMLARQITEIATFIRLVATLLSLARAEDNGTWTICVDADLIAQLRREVERLSR